MSTYIEYFDELVLGKNSPTILHIVRDAINETITAQFHNFTNLPHEHNTRAELRTKGNEYALFLFQYPDSKLSEWWQDSKLIWSIGEETKQDKWKKILDFIDENDITSDEINEALTKLGKKYEKSI